MSMLVSVQAPSGALAVSREETRGAFSTGRNRGAARDPVATFGLACRDVIDEVRQRMEVRGYRWE